MRCYKLRLIDKKKKKTIDTKVVYVTEDRDDLEIWDALQALKAEYLEESFSVETKRMKDVKEIPDIDKDKKEKNEKDN